MGIHWGCSGNQVHKKQKISRYHIFWGRSKSNETQKLKLILAVVASSLCASAAVITNGTFDTNCTGWTATSVDSNGGCRAAEGNPDGMFLINNGGASATNPSIEQSVTDLVIGQTYLLQGDFHNYYGCCDALPNNVNAFGVEIGGVLRIRSRSSTAAPRRCCV